MEIFGWIILAAIVLVLIGAMIKMRERKADERLNRKSYCVLIARFPYTTVPIDVPRARGTAICERLREIYLDAWGHFDIIYDKVRKPTTLPISTLHLIYGEVDPPEHPEVELHLQPGICTLSLDYDYEYRFVGEVHNAYRYRHFGIQQIYQGDWMTPAEREQYRRAIVVVASFRTHG